MKYKMEILLLFISINFIYIVIMFLLPLILLFIMWKWNETKLNIVEFGAGDIEENSNTFYLLKNSKINYSVFIEMDQNLFKKLEKLILEIKNL